MSKFGKAVKKILKISGVILGLTLLVLVAVPYFFKEDILNQLKRNANEQLDAHLEFDNSTVDLSLIWSFPNFSFSIQSITLRGKGVFEGKKLADIGRFYCTINMMDVFNGIYTINDLSISAADFWIKVLRNGQANYAIFKGLNSKEQTSETATSSKALKDNFSLKVSYWALENINFIYDDLSSGTYIEVKKLNHQGSGDFSLVEFDMNTNTRIEALSFTYKGLKYLKNTAVSVQFNALIDPQNSVCTIKENVFSLNELELQANGTILYKNDLDFDLKFNAPSTSFASILSMVPDAYTTDFKSVKTKGDFEFSATLKGTYNETILPSFAIDFKIQDAYFKYPDLAMPVQDIQAQVSIKSSAADLDKMAVDITKFHFKIGTHPFDAQLKLGQLISDPSIFAQIKGTVDLEDLFQAFPSREVQEMSGLINADLTTTTKMSYVNNNEYDKIEMQGALSVSNMKYKIPNLPMMQLSSLKMDFTPNHVLLHDLDFKIGRSDLKASGTLDNLLSYFSSTKTMRGQLSVQSQQLDMNELYADELAVKQKTEGPNQEEAATSMRDTTEAIVGPFFDRFNIELQADFKSIDYQEYQLQNVRCKGAFSPNYAVLQNLEIQLGDIDFQAKGQVEQLYNYLLGEAVLKGTLTVYSNYMNLNQFMEAEQALAAATDSLPQAEQVTADLKPLQLPGNIDFALLTSIKTLIYDNYPLKNVQAEVHLHDRLLDVNALRAQAFGGRLAMNGQYNSQNPEKPSFELAYDVSNLDIQAVAKTVGLSKRLLPILRSVYGKFDAELEMKGVLDKNRNPDLNTLFATGMLKTFQTSVKNNASLRVLASRLKIEELKQLNLGNTTNFMKFEKGRLQIEPASYKVRGIDIIAGGSHGLDKTIDYALKMRIPRGLLSKNTIGKVLDDALGSGLEALAGQAKKIGLDLKISEFINMAVDVEGTVQKPKFKLKLLGGETKSGTSLGDEAANLLKEEAARLKEAAAAKAKAEIERIRAAAEAKLQAEQERLRNEAAEKARKLAEAAANNPGAIIDSLKGIDPAKVVDPSKIIDPDKMGTLFNKIKDKDKNNPFGKFKNPFGPK